MNYSEEKIASRFKQSERSLRPECGADAPTFLSAVYNRGTQAKKRQADVPQYGRSMIEMLGVLAITGILTVGGMTSFQKVMRKHRMNVMRDQIIQVVQSIKNLYASQHNYNDLTTQVAIDAGIIPNDMVIEDVGNGQTKVKHIYNGNISIEVNTETKEPSFKITINNLPRDAAVDLSTAKWSEDTSLLELELTKENTTQNP